MKQKREKLMRALSYADDEYITEAAPVHVKPSKRRFLKSLTALAASLLILITGYFSLWLFLPEANVNGFFPFVTQGTDEVLRFTVCRIDDRLAIYYFEDDLSRFEEWRLERKLGEVYFSHAKGTFYRIKGEDNLEYLIYKVHGNPKLSLLKFDSLFVFDSLDTALQSGWHTDGGILSRTDLESLRYEDQPSFGEILEKIYGVRTAEGIKKVELSYRFGEKKSTATLKDTDETAHFYSLLFEVQRADIETTREIYNLLHDKEAYQDGTAARREEWAQKVTVCIQSGAEITITYYPTDGLLCQGTDSWYVPLTNAQNKALLSLLGINP